MKLSGNTVLITGGTSGIGYEFAAQFLKRGNTVIITGRNQRRLEEARNNLPGVHTFQCDVRNPEAITALFDAVTGELSALNVLINSAGIMRRVNVLDRENNVENISGEIETNLTGTVRMVMQFLPHLNAQKEAAIVNISSGLAFVPLPIAAIYCATKAAVHSFTQSLRVQLKNTRVRVFEVAPPMTRTPLFTGEIHTADVSGVSMMDVSRMVSEAMKGMEKDDWEIRPGMSNLLKFMSRLAPALILKRLSRSVDAKVSGGTPR